MIEKLMKKAISFLGVSEPTGDDQFIQYYNNLTRAGFNMAVAWCAIFVTVVARMVGIQTSIIPTFASCDIGANWFRNKGRYEKGKYYGGNYTPKRGDVIFYSSKYTQNDSTHVGYVVSVTGETIKAIEGNKSDAVGYRTIKASDKYILGYGRVADFVDGSSGTHATEQAKEFQCSVSDFQSYLNRQYPNTIKTNCGALLAVDDDFGEKTRDAALCVWKYEMNKKKAGYTFDLKNRNFLTKCKEYANKYAVVKNGSKGRFVYIAQGLLRAKGFYYGDLDGDAGSITDAAIRAFQSKNGLAVDGSCGADTWTKLFKL